MFEKLKPVIAEALSVSEDEIQLSSSFKNDLDADSLDLYQLVMDLEDMYGIEIPAEELDSIDTVEQMIDFISETLKKNGEE